MEIKCHPTNRTAEILLYDDIGMGGIETADVTKQIAAVGADNASIDVRINSGGGSVWVGNAIYNALLNSPATITTHNDALAGSIASVIMMAGSQRIAASNSMFMMHPPMWGEMGNHKQVRAMADNIEKLEPGVVEAYRRGGANEETVNGLMWANDGKGTFLNASEQIEHGFATDLSGQPALCCPHIPEGIAQRMELVAWVKTLPAKEGEPCPVSAMLDQDIAKLRRDIDLTKLTYRL